MRNQSDRCDYCPAVAMGSMYGCLNEIRNEDLTTRFIVLSREVLYRSGLRDVPSGNLPERLWMRR
jgi:hypothetical protein